MKVENLMIVSEKSHKNLSVYIQFLFLKDFKFDKRKRLFLVKKMRNSGNYSYAMLTRSLGRVFNPSRYTDK